MPAAGCFLFDGQSNRLQLDASCPSFTEALLGPAGSAMTHSGIIATDGAVKIDGRMGAAYVSQGNRMAAQFWAV